MTGRRDPDGGGRSLCRGSVCMFIRQCRSLRKVMVQETSGVDRTGGLPGRILSLDLCTQGASFRKFRVEWGYQILSFGFDKSCQKVRELVDKGWSEWSRSGLFRGR